MSLYQWIQPGDWTCWNPVWRCDRQGFVVFTSSSVQGRAIVGATFVAQLGIAVKEGESAMEIKIMSIAAAWESSSHVNGLQNVS